MKIRGLSLYLFMDFILILVAVFLIVRSVIVKSLGAFTPDEFPNKKDSNITINNYTTEQHLHVTEKQLEKLKK